MAPAPELLAHASEVVDAWAGLGMHPQLSVPRSTFVSADYDGHPALFIAHDYHAGAATLEAAHLQPQVTANGLVQVSASLPPSHSPSLRTPETTFQGCQAPLGLESGFCILELVVTRLPLGGRLLG